MTFHTKYRIEIFNKSTRRYDCFATVNTLERARTQVQKPYYRQHSTAGRGRIVKVTYEEVV